MISGSVFEVLRFSFFLCFLYEEKSQIYTLWLILNYHPQSTHFR